MATLFSVEMTHQYSCHAVNRSTKSSVGMNNSMLTKTGYMAGWILSEPMAVPMGMRHFVPPSKVAPLGNASTDCG